MKKLFKFIPIFLTALLFSTFCHSYTNFVVDGTTYPFPNTNDEEWGDYVTDWGEAVTNNLVKITSNTRVSTTAITSALYSTYSYIMQGNATSYLNINAGPQVKSGPITVSSLTVNNEVTIGSMTSYGTITSSSGFIGGSSTFTSVVVNGINLTNRISAIATDTSTLKTRIDNLDSSTATLTNRLNSVATDTGTLKTRVDGLSYSTQTFGIFITTAQQKIDSVSSSTQTFGLFLSTAQGKFDSFSLFRSSFETGSASISSLTVYGSITSTTGYYGGKSTGTFGGLRADIYTLADGTTLSSSPFSSGGSGSSVVYGTQAIVTDVLITTVGADTNLWRVRVTYKVGDAILYFSTHVTMALNCEGGSTSDSASKFYYLYFMTKNGTCTVVATDFSTSTPKNTFGYSNPTKIGTVYNDSSSNVLPLWSNGKKVKLLYPQVVLNTAGLDTHVEVDMDGSVPEFARKIYMNVWYYPTGDQQSPLVLRGKGCQGNDTIAPTGTEGNVSIKATGTQAFQVPVEVSLCDYRDVIIGDPYTKISICNLYFEGWEE